MILTRNKIPTIAALKDSDVWETTIYTGGKFDVVIPQNEREIMMCFLRARLNWNIFKNDRHEVKSVRDFIAGYCAAVDKVFDGFSLMCNAPEIENPLGNDFLYGMTCAINELTWWSLPKEKEHKQKIESYADPFKPVSKF